MPSIYNQLPDREDFLFTIVQYLIAEKNEFLAYVLSNSEIDYMKPSNNSLNVYVILKIPHAFYKKIIEEYRDELNDLISSLYPHGGWYIYNGTLIHLKIEESNESWRQEAHALIREGLVNNQASFTSSKAPMLTHGFLKFRSKTEVRIMQEFERFKQILVFPLPVAVCGNERKEPDFLVCYKGKWAILEIVSDTYHPSVEKEANRTAWFQNHNIQIRSVPAKKCYNQPHNVVMEFLNWLSNL